MNGTDHWQFCERPDGTVEAAVDMGVPIGDLSMHPQHRPLKPPGYPWAISAIVPLAVLVPVQAGVARPMLLAERFWPGAGWIEIVLLTLYSLWLFRAACRTGNAALFRRRYWLFFTVVFFAQLLIGLYVSPAFLMSGELHLPVPALILAGPLYRGAGFFMLILLLATVLVAGPGWCSHLCYIGACDLAAATARRKPAPVSRHVTLAVRYAMLAAVVASAWLFNLGGVRAEVAFGAALAFGLLGAVIMALISRRDGYMAHCTRYCPVGGFVSLLARLYPLRVTIDRSACDRCMACATRCRYDALNGEDIASGRAGWNCTLCGDCLSVCAKKAMSVKRMGGERELWPLYRAVVIGLHAAFIGLARL
ncbi:MAG: 4Fe-4S binding protein [Thermodesulfobacteriota bacterium]